EHDLNTDTYSATGTLYKCNTRALFFFFFFNDTATTEIYTFPYTTLFRSVHSAPNTTEATRRQRLTTVVRTAMPVVRSSAGRTARSEEHTSELQSRGHLVCRLLLEKKKRALGSMFERYLIGYCNSL